VEAVSKPTEVIWQVRATRKGEKIILEMLQTQEAHDDENQTAARFKEAAVAILVQYEVMRRRLK
jgi:hypothetical protein